MSVLLGGAIGSGSTLLADRVRWRREREDRQQDRDQAHRERQCDIRRQVYTEYLTALSRLRNELREVVRNASFPLEDRAAKVQEVFLASGGYELRTQLQIIAPAVLTERSEKAYWALQDLRIHVEQGARYRDEMYLRYSEEYRTTLRALRQGMREDLGVDLPSDG